MRRSLVPLLLTAAVVLVFAPGPVAAADTAHGIYRGVLPVVKFDVSPPLRELAQLPAVPASGRNLLADPASGLEGPLGPQDVDPLVQSWVGPTMEIPGPLVSFNGPSNISGVQPPDTIGDVGPNHYVSMTNLSFAVYSKTGTVLLGPLANNSLWAGFGGDCQTDNSGDPVILYDETSDRWMLSQFTASGPTYFNCVAVSTSADPTGSYFRWAFSTGTNFPDYPKYGFWPDGLYISTREFAGGSTFAGIGAYAVERADLVSGNPAPTVISFLATPASAGGAFNIGDGLLPSDWDGPIPPPAGSPNYFIGSMDNGAGTGAPQDALTVWEFHADFVTPANSTFTLPTTLPIAAYDTIPAFCSGRSCVPQPGTANKVDLLGYRQRPMHRAAYRNFGSHESIVTNQSVEASATMSGIRWWEIRNLSGTPTLFQEGTYAPGTTDGIHRWMASIAQDSAGNMALGFSVSASTVTFPGVVYTGRLSTDPLGTMPQGEATIVAGTGAQTSGQRWGDYSSMNIDPVDDCTFWYTQEWYAANGGNWQTRIGSFKFNECGTPDFFLGATPASQTICAGADAEYTIDVGSIAGFANAVTLGATGQPAGTTATFVPNPVTPPNPSTFTVGNTGAAAGGTYSITVSGTASGSPGHSTAVELVVDAGNPAAASLTSPADGATDVPLRPTFSWAAAAGASSYLIEVDDDANFSSPVYSDTVVLTSATPASDLPSLTVLYWRVTASNSCGSTASAVFSFTTEAAPGDCPAGTTARPLYDYGFESGLSGWTSSGTGSTWAVTTTAAYVHSGTHAMHATGPAAVSDQRLVSPAVVLPTGQDPVVLSFWNFQTIEDAAGGCFDGAIVEVSNNGGTTWTQVPNADLLTDPYDGTVSGSFANPLAGRAAWCGDPQPYLESVADLTPYAGQTVQIRFRFGTDNRIGRPDGWNIDDVQVQSCLPANFVFIGDFETGDTSQWSSTLP